MRRGRVVGLWKSVLVVLLVGLSAQDALSQERDTRVGLGIGVTTVSLAEVEALMMPRVHLPVVVDERWMFEPALGFLRVSDDDSSETLLGVDVGGFLLLGSAAEGRVYVGPRLGLLRVSGSVDVPGVSDPDSQTNLTLAGLIGGEYFLGSNFSLGGEAGVRWIELDDGNLVSTVSSFRIRWYFP
jgi:hypothetical protein